jgi:hypothetical protein
MSEFKADSYIAINSYLISNIRILIKINSAYWEMIK